MTSPTAILHDEMICELLARRAGTLRTRAALVQAINEGPKHLAEVDERLAAIGAELKEYGHVEPQAPALVDIPGVGVATDAG